MEDFWLKAQDWDTLKVLLFGVISHQHAVLSSSLHLLLCTVSHSYGYGLLDAGAMVGLAQNWTTLGPQHQCIHTVLTEPRLEGWLESVFKCKMQLVLVLLRTLCSIFPLSLIDVTASSSRPGRPLRFFAQCDCLCPSLQPHNINHSLLHLSNLQRHRKQTGVQQERGCLLGTTRVCQLSGARSGSPHSLPQPERKIGHSSHQPTGHAFHPAVPKVHSKTCHTSSPGVM